jgi:hypothetical protein
MNLLETIMRASNGGALQSAAKQAGLDNAAAQSLLAKVMPALAGGLKQNVQSKEGLEQLAQALGKGNHQRFLDDPASLEGEAAKTEGNAILGHLFGSKDVSRRVAAEAAEQTGIDIGVIKRFLPMAAAVGMGALSKETAGGANLLGSGADAASGLLGRLLDTGGAGGALKTLFSLKKKLF